MVQEAVADQLKNLEEKLHEYKVRHKAEEEAVEDDIAVLEDTLAEVKVSLERRKRELEAEVQAEAAAAAAASTSLSTKSLPAAALGEQVSANGDSIVHVVATKGHTEGQVFMMSMVQCLF